ncbi:hypothetical protein [Aphanothece sacrum]|uniref:Glycogen phosphorylase n=1 Tax=Aphanothece sacrum FPU1 TaxID=1920663 RepID=A0A401IHX8_APHSA|nr:hypothetical protein [Aphanothece sacrum]GBF80915.1 glycogen phosphorylase [Aphanothece sacrum FPU1]GBF85222.1 glycogen phosphorylase [Aphanothece sacrum FPU3]
MSIPIIWQEESNDPDKGYNLSLISQWWESLKDQENFWQQRLIPDNSQVKDLNWERQGFDEKLLLQKPQVRGITLYWHKLGDNNEHSITPKKLELDETQGYLDIYPKSQSKLIIRVSKLPVYETVEIKNPLIAGTAVGSDYILVLRDKQKKLEVKLILNADSLQQLIKNLLN